MNTNRHVYSWHQRSVTIVRCSPMNGVNGNKRTNYQYNFVWRAPRTARRWITIANLRDPLLWEGGDLWEATMSCGVAYLVLVSSAADNRQSVRETTISCFRLTDFSRGDDTNQMTLIQFWCLEYVWCVTNVRWWMVTQIGHRTFDKYSQTKMLPRL